MFAVAAFAIGVAMVLTFVRLCAGPTLYDRVAALNAFGTETVLLIGVLGFLTGRPDFLDIALLYALINFVGTIARSKILSLSGNRRPRLRTQRRWHARRGASRHERRRC